MMILTPEQIEKVTETDYGPDLYAVELFETLAAYADIVQAVAETPPYERISQGGEDWEYQCVHCGVVVPYAQWARKHDMKDWQADHAPDCLYLAARKLRGVA